MMLAGSSTVLIHPRWCAPILDLSDCRVPTRFLITHRLNVRARSTIAYRWSIVLIFQLPHRVQYFESSVELKAGV